MGRVAPNYYLHDAVVVAHLERCGPHRRGRVIDERGDGLAVAAPDVRDAHADPHASHQQEACHARRERRTQSRKGALPEALAGGSSRLAALLRLGVHDLPSELRQAVIAAALVVLHRRRPAARFGDEPVAQRPLDHAVQRSGAEGHLPAGARFDLFQNAVAVAVGVAQREQDMEHHRGQRKQCGGIPHGSMAPHYIS